MTSNETAISFDEVRERLADACKIGWIQSWSLHYSHGRYSATMTYLPNRSKGGILLPVHTMGWSDPDPVTALFLAASLAINYRLEWHTP